MQSRITRFLMVAAAVALGAVLFLSVAGCQSCQEEKIDPAVLKSLTNDRGIAISRVLDEGERQEAARLVGKFGRGRFPERLISRSRNAPLFLFIAAKSDRQDLVAAALKAMKKAYAPMGSKDSGRPSADEDYGKVVVAHLQSKEAAVQSAALSAAYNLVAGRAPHQPTVEALHQIVKSHPVVGARLDAVNALIRAKDFRKNAQVTGALLDAIRAPHAALVSHTLYQLYQNRAEGLAHRAEFLQQARALLKNADPGVRGRAARLAAVLAPTDDELRGIIRAMLDDRQPYARSTAAHALADMHDVASIHKLVAKIGDFERNNHHIRYAKLGGGNGSIPHGSKSETVHEPVAVALERLSEKIKPPYRRVSRDRKNPARKKNAEAARSWYEKVRDQLPEPPAGVTMPELDAGAGSGTEGADAGAAELAKSGEAKKAEAAGKAAGKAAAAAVPKQPPRVKTAAPAP